MGEGILGKQHPNLQVLMQLFSSGWADLQYVLVLSMIEGFPFTKAVFSNVSWLLYEHEL